MWVYGLLTLIGLGIISWLYIMVILFIRIIKRLKEKK
jgi:hypothetical protein